MKILSFAIITIIVSGCSDKINVTSIDQIPGKWQWESTCGGIVYECTYSSKSTFAKIEFTSNGRYIEKHNDTIYLQTNYSISKYDDMMGTLILENPSDSRPITILDNRLLISRGELMDRYIKIK
jgi:hypothetical protein